MTRFSGRPHGSVTAIPSKSAAHRYMICAALAQGRSVIRGLPGELPDDLTATLDCIRALGAAAVFRDDTLEITGINAKPDVLRLDCRDSGATYRLLYPVAPLIGGRAEFMLSPSLAARPMEPVTELLKSKGVAAEKLSVSGSFGHKGRRFFPIYKRAAAGAVAAGGGKPHTAHHSSTEQKLRRIDPRFALRIRRREPMDGPGHHTGKAPAPQGRGRDR